MLKEQKGITLIALVITIIVLLILAGITIAMISGQESTPNKAVQAKIQNEVGAAKDSVVIKAAELVENWYEAKYVKNQPLEASVQELVSNVSNYPSSGADAVVTDKVKVTAGTTANTIVITANEKDTQGNTCSVTGTVDTKGVITWGGIVWAK